MKNKEIEELANTAYHAIRASKSYGRPNDYHLQRAEDALIKLLDKCNYFEYSPKAPESSGLVALNKKEQKPSPKCGSISKRKVYYADKIG